MLTASCAPSVKYQALQPAAPPKGLADPVDVYVDDSKIPPGVTLLGELRVGDSGFSTGCDLNTVMSIVKDKARSVGADAVYVVRVTEPDFSSTCYRVRARLLKYAQVRTASEANMPPLASPGSFARVTWRRTAPGANDIVQLTETDRYPSAKTDAFERAADAIVRISGSRGAGSGFFITRDGLALTNHHVVEGQTDLQASLRDGRHLAVRVLRSDVNADIALIEIACSTDCFTLDMAASNPKVGTDVSVIGNPMALDYTLTRGVVSGLRLAGGVTLIQTDAALNPGNSGGPILDGRTNQVLGVVSWKVTGDRAEGLGFGVTAVDALRVLGVQRQ
jgi:S1-C subfamily serine protease